MYNILIAENIPSLNKGELEILGGIRECFTELGAVKIFLLSPRPDIDAPRYGDEITTLDMNELFNFKGRSSNHLSDAIVGFWVGIKHAAFVALYLGVRERAFRIMQSSIWKAYIESDIILMGHDNAFNMRGMDGPLFYPIYLPLFARLLKKKVVFFGGSVKTKDLNFLQRFVFKHALKQFDMITLREDESYKNCIDLGLPKDSFQITSDPAFIVKPANLARVMEIIKIEKLENQDNLVAMTVTQKKARSAFPKLDPKESYNRHIDTLVHAVDYITTNLNATVVFLPHCIGPESILDDRIIQAEIYERCKNKDKIRLITNEYSAPELKGLLGQANLVIGERIHSIINSISMGTPSIVISNANDNRLRMFEMIGLDEMVCIVDDLKTSDLIAKIDDIWSKRPEIRKKLLSQMSLTKDAAMMNGRLLREVMETEKLKI